MGGAGLYALTEEHEAIREAVRDIAEHEIAPYAAEVDADSRYPIEAQKALTAAGFHATHIPEEYGGEGADAIATCIVIEEVARVDASASLIPAVNKLGSMPIILSASEELKQTVLPSIAAGDTWVLGGTKAWITNAGVSSWYTVMAVTDPENGANGISAFAVHRDDPGFAVGPKERKMGIKGSPTCELYFTDCTIPADRIIGARGTGFKTALRTLDFTRPTIGAQAVGIAQGALDAAVGYVKDRKQFGTSIGSFQGVQFMLADMEMKIAAARHLVYVAAAAGEQGRPDVTRVSASAKAFASDVAMQVTTDAVQLFGGAGYTQDFPVERMMRDAKITQIYEGTNQVQRMVIARSLLK